MATDKEARETTDGLEVQVEAANDLQTQLDSKLSSIKEIKGEAQTMDSTEGILKIPEDQVLVEAPSETKIPPEHNLNGMASSLNGHVDKEENMSNEQPHESNQESQEQVETSPEGTSTKPSNKINEEEITDSLRHGESASEDTTLLKCENAEAKDHGQQDFKGHVMNATMVQEIDNAIEQTVDAHDLDPSKKTKDSQPAIMTSVLDDEVLAETMPGIQSPLKPNVDDSDAIPDTIDGNKESDELAKEDEDKVIAEHADEEAKLEDLQSKQADDMDAEVLQEEISESKEPDVPKTEQADEASIDDQEALNQQPALETIDSLSVKAEEMCHKERFPEEKIIAEHAEEEVKVEDQQSKQADDIDEEVLQEEISESKEPDVPKTEQADETSIDDQEALNQQPALETNDSLSVKAEEMCHKESFPEEKILAEHAEEEAKVEDQQSKQADDIDAEVLQEEISERKEPDVPKTEQADETSIDDQEALNQEPALETNGSLSVKAEEMCHKESFPEEKIVAEHAEEEAKVDQQSKQADDMDAEVLQEEISESKEPDVPKTEQTDETPIDDQEPPNQEPALETNDSLSVNEETCHESNVVTGGERTPEDDVTTRESAADTKEKQNQGSVQEVKDAEAVDTEEIVKQSSVAFDEAIQDHAATTDPSSGIQHIQNIEPEETKDPSAVKAEEVSGQSNVTFAEDAVQDKVIPSDPPEDIQPVQELEQEETKKDDEASDKTNPAIFSNLNQEDGILAGELHVTELAEEAAAFSNLDQEGGMVDSEPHVAELEEAKEIEATETEEITCQSPVAISTELPIEDNLTASEPHNDDAQHSLGQDSIEVKDTEADEIQGISHERTIATSKDDAVEDDGTEEGPTCVSQEIQDAESAEEIKEIKAGNVVETSNVATVDDTEQENSVLTSENIAELQLQGLESEEIKSPEPIEAEEDFNKSHAAPFSDPVQEVNTTACETENTKSAVKIKETEDNKTESIPQEGSISISEEPTPEDSITASETISNTQELRIAGSIEAIEDNKDTKTGEIADQSNEVFAGETAQGDNILESVSTADIQPMQELESEEMKKAELVDLSGTFHQKDDDISQKQNQEDSPTTCQTNVIESEVSNVEASEDQAIAHQSNIIQCEEQATEESTESGPQILEMESVQDIKDTEATEPEFISQQNIISTSEVSVPQENATAKEPAFDDREIQNDGSESTKEHDGVKVEEIPDQSSGAIVEETAQEANLLPSEPTDDVQVRELEPKEIRNTVDGETEEASHQTHDAAVEDNWTTCEVEMTESSEQMRDTKPTVPEPTLHDSNVASVEEIEAHDNAAIEQNVGDQQLQEQESVECKETEALEPQGIIPPHNVSSAEEFNPQETVTKEEPSSDTQAGESSVVIEDTEDVNNSGALSEKAAPEEHMLATEATVDTAPVAAPEEHIIATEATVDTPPQDLELEEMKNIESVEAEDNIAASDLPGEEMDVKAIETESIPHESTTAGVKELTEDVKSNVALAEEAASEQHMLETEVTVDKSSVQEPELEEIKNTGPAEQEHNITETGLPEEEVKDNEDMETETVPHDSNIESIMELSEDDTITASAPDADTQQVPGQESVEDITCTDTTEHPGETSESILSTSDELTQTGEITTVTETTFDTQQVQSFTDKETELSNFSTPEEAVQESDLLKSKPETDAQQEQELDSTEENKGTEEDQKNGVSTFEESVTDVGPNVDDQHVQENKSVVEVKENEDTETEEIFKQINFTTSENAAQESSEPVTDQPFYVQSVQQIESTKENNQLVEAEEKSSQSNTVTAEDPTAEDRVANEIDPSVDIDQGNELELVEEIKDTDATEAEKTSHTGQTVSLAEQFSETNISAAELTQGIQQVNDLEATEDMKGTEDTGDEEICHQQTGTSEDPSPTDDGKSQDYPVESNEENLGNGIDDVISVHEKIEDNIHESAEMKDEAPELGEKTQVSANRTEEDDDHISTEDTEETSNNINQVKEGPNEHGSSEISNVQDNEQLHDVVLQTQVCERSLDTIVIEQQDEAMKNVNLDQLQNEDEEIEKQKEELQIDEQKHDGKRADFIIDTQVESIDAFKAEQTDPVVVEKLNDEVTQQISKDSIPRTADAMVQNITKIKEETEEENRPNNDGTSEVSAKNYNEDVQENTDKDAVVAKTSSSKQDETTGEIRNEEFEPCLESSLERDLQADSDLSNDQMLENNPIVVPQNDEYRLHRVEEEHANKVNADMHAIQESDKVSEDAEEKQGMQNEDNVVHHDESLTTTEMEETSQLHTNEQYSADNKMDDTTISYEEMIHENTSTQPREDIDTEEKKGFNAFPEFVVETSKQNDIDQDFSSHYQIEDEKSAETENNYVEVEAVQPKLDMSIAETNNENNLSITNPLPEHETENASDINQNTQYQEATNADAIDKVETGCIEKMETAATEMIASNEDICDKASGAEEVPSDESLKTFEDTRRNLDVSSVVTESKGENVNKEMVDHKLALPVHPTQDANTSEQGFNLDDTEKDSMSPEKALAAEQEEQEENQVTKEQDEEDGHDLEIDDAQKEDHKDAEQDYLPVSSFLMNLILGKETDDPKIDSETKVEKKQEETTKDDGCLIVSQQEESLLSFPVENTLDENLTFEQEKENVEGSEETKEPVKEQSHDVKVDAQKSSETDEELKRNTHDLEAPVYQDNAQDETSSKAKAADPTEKMEARDFELDEKSFDTVCQENVETATETEEESLNRNQDDVTSPKASQEDASEEVETELPHESLHENRHDAKAEQTFPLIEPDIANAEKLPNDADNVQSPPCTEQEKSIESSYVTPEVQVESEVAENKGENQHTNVGGRAEEGIENIHDDKSKGTCSEAISDEESPETTEPVSHTERNVAYENEIPASSSCMDKNETKISNNEVSNFEKALEIHSDSPNLNVNQNKKDESADNQIAMEHNTMLDKLEDSNLQEEQENVAQKFPKETEGNKKLMAITKHVIKEENVHETVESSMQTVKIKSNEEQELSDSQVQERGHDVVSPKATSEVEDNFVEITKPEFSTDEEHSPKAAEANMTEEKTCDEKTKAEEENNNITDEATVRVEERGAEQKVSHKKHNILSGVGSKVKHQLAKVKKAIIGKPGHTKSESPKS